jgi:superfamily II DNA/RNA helicase
LGVDPRITSALQAEGITHPFPIQEQAIPIALKGTDLIGQARTGTGKTLAFGIPLLERLELPSPSKLPQALVMCPTRELALQVAADMATASSGIGAKVLTVYGGVGYDTQLDALASGVDVVVGTPGRLLDLLHRRSLNLSKVKVLVLDEADEMLDLGFLPDVERLIAATPASRQTMLFSATMPAAIVSLARSHLNQAINIRAESQEEAATVPATHQFVYQAHDLDKPAIIGKLLQAPSATRVMVFCTTKRAVQRLSDDLTERGFTVTSMHGDLSQVLREKSLARFKAGKAQVIICTDVAARGIDVDNVTHVVNYDCPDDDKTYVHRIGRTGRAGRSGVAITLVDWADLPRWRVINNALGLPFNDPLEAYSTTPQLLEELGIPADATGRLVDAAPAGSRSEHSANHNGDRRRSNDRSSASSDGRSRRSGAGSPAAGRRQRRSNGVVVRAKKESVAPVEAGTTVPDGSPAAPAVNSDKSTRSRRRRRSHHGTRPSQSPEPNLSPTN